MAKKSTKSRGGASLSLASPALVRAMNEQIGHEMHASFQYTSIACHFAGESLTELARFFIR